MQASVSSVDDPLMPVNTFRMWFLGILFSLLTSGANQVLYMRCMSLTPPVFKIILSTSFLDPSIFVSYMIPQILCLPLGRGLAAILPTKCFNTFGYIWSLNPGPFSIKEHVCISVMVSVTYRGVYSNDITLTQHAFYGKATPMTFQILLSLGTQLLGFSIGGLLCQFVVWPSSMIWPGVLGDCAFFNALHKNYSKHDQGQITQKQFFWVVMGGSFVWCWVPGYFFTGLSMFNWVCWIAPKNTVINVLFGTSTGMGMSTLTFDWAIISSIINPLIIPVGPIPLFYLVYYSHLVIPSGGPK